MKLGFTGTRDGLTCEQHAALLALLKGMPVITEFHYGCCVGADEEAFDITFELEPTPKTIGHPPTSKKLMSRWKDHCTELRTAEPYLIRNRRIVDETEKLIACPKGDEELRSGTWSTIRYARKCRKPVVIVWSDGSTTTE